MIGTQTPDERPKVLVTHAKKKRGIKVSSKDERNGTAHVFCSSKYYFSKVFSSKESSTRLLPSKIIKKYEIVDQRFSRKVKGWTGIDL